jgi:hypothetical protein
LYPCIHPASRMFQRPRSPIFLLPSLRAWAMPNRQSVANHYWSMLYGHQWACTQVGQADRFRHLDRVCRSGRPKCRAVEASLKSVCGAGRGTGIRRRGPDRRSGPLLSFRVRSERSGEILAAAAECGHAEETGAQEEHGAGLGDAVVRRVRLSLRQPLAVEGNSQSDLAIIDRKRLHAREVKQAESISCFDREHKIAKEPSRSTDIISRREVQPPQLVHVRDGGLFTRT